MDDIMELETKLSELISIQIKLNYFRDQRIGFGNISTNVEHIRYDRIW